MEKESKINEEICFEDCLAEFSCRYKEVFSSFSILRDALSNDMKDITFEQIEDMIEILFERMEENTASLEKVINVFHKEVLKLKPML